MASLIASANPVGVWGEAAAGATTITWDTDASPNARVYLTTVIGGTTTETLFDGNPVTGSDEGSKVLPVKFGGTYVLVMKQVSNGAILASATVTVKDIRADLTAEAARYAALDKQFGSIQAIYDVSVTAGIDTCRVKFKTIQPTIPRVQANGPDGTLVANLFPLFGGMRTEHDLVLGDVAALPLETQVTVTIIAAGHNALNLPVEATTKRAFTTGSRRVKIEFLEIEVHSDGDDFIKGEGDFKWSFYAGDAETGEWQAFDFLKLPMPSGGPRALIKATLSIPRAARKLWVQAVGEDRDITFSGSIVPSVVEYTGEGSSFASSPNWDRTQVTRIFKLEELEDGTAFPFDLATGDFDVAFAIKGRITVNTAAGQSPHNFSFSEWTDGGRVTQVEGAGSIGKLKKFATDIDPNVDGKVQGHILAKGADGALYRQVVQSRRDWRRDQEWTRAAPAVEGPVTAVLATRDRITLFTVDRAGVVLRADLDGSRRPGEWRSLGGRFIGRVTALARAKAIELFANDAEGAVYHRGMDDGGHWQRIGDGVRGAPLAVATDDASFTVFALSHRGTVLMKRNRDGRWQSKGWQTLDGVTGIRLGASAIEGQGVALAVIDRDMVLHTLAAPDESGLNTGSWIAHGDLQAWLSGERALPNVETKSRKRSPKIAA